MALEAKAFAMATLAFEQRFPGPGREEGGGGLELAVAAEASGGQGLHQGIDGAVSHGELGAGRQGLPPLPLGPHQLPPGEQQGHRHHHQAAAQPSEHQPAPPPLATPPLVFGRRARLNELPLSGSQLLRALLELRSRLRQGRSPQQATLLARRGPPLGEGASQALLPGAKAAIVDEPVAQRAPVADQGFVHHLHGVVAGGVAAGHHQTVVRQAPGQGPAGLTQLLAGGQAAGVFRAFARPHELKQHPTGLLLFSRGQSVQTGIGMAGEGPFHAADFGVGGMGDQGSLAPSPELGEGKLQQGEMARLGGHIVQNALHQAGFKRHRVSGGRSGGNGGGLLDRLAQLDRLPQLDVIHRAEHHHSFAVTLPLEELGKGAVGEGIAQEVRPHREQQPGGRAWRGSAGGAATRGKPRQQNIQKRPPLPLLQAAAVELLKLIGDQQQLVLRRVVAHPSQHIRQG